MARFIMEEGKLNAKIKALLNEEKQMRLSADVVSTRMVVIEIIQLCYKAKAWKTLYEQFLLLSKRRLHLKQALTAVVTSIEDHGYLLSFGVLAILGFLLHKNYLDDIKCFRTAY